MTCKLPPTVRVHQIAIFPLGMINAFLVQGPDGCLLIDSGLPNSEDKIRKTLDALNLRFEDIKLIIITHAHIDHAGNTATLKALSGAQVIAHQADLAYFRGEKKMHFCSTGWFGWLFKKNRTYSTGLHRLSTGYCVNTGGLFQPECLRISG